jgi:hypothetical protein
MGVDLRCSRPWSRDREARRDERRSKDFFLFSRSVLSERGWQPRVAMPRSARFPRARRPRTGWPRNSMRATLPTSSRSCCGSHPSVAAHQRPSGRSHPTGTDPSTITSPTTTSRTQIRPGIHRARRDTTEHNRSPPQSLTDAPAQISSSARQDAALLVIVHRDSHMELRGVALVLERGRRSRSGLHVIPRGESRDRSDWSGPTGSPRSDRTQPNARSRLYAALIS